MCKGNVPQFSASFSAQNLDRSRKRRDRKVEAIHLREGLTTYGNHAMTMEVFESKGRGDRATDEAEAVPTSES